MKKLNSFSLFILLAICAIIIAWSSYSQEKGAIDVQGHRGARGNFPENSIPGFVFALEAGVTTLEMDVVVTKDKQLVVSHEPWMNADICETGDKAQEELNIYQMTYEQVKGFDCGSKGNPKFEQQEPMKMHKPLLSMVIDTVEKLVKQGQRRVKYNIETKSRPEGDGIYHPAPAEFAKLLYTLLKEKGILDHVTIQSFDPRTLQEMKKTDPKIALVLLVENGLGLEKNVDLLGFTPQVYSPYFKLVNAELVNEAHERGMKVIPWTVNDSSMIKELLAHGVDGIITDYPEMGVRIAREYIKHP
ncbi:MAG: glycerophosphodiester phosphodiesterase [Chitinophagales bacterium]|nr:glycerophosphodiester phosphodiesterase [Chitinophagales bacterium]